MTGAKLRVGDKRHAREIPAASAIVGSEQQTVSMELPLTTIARYLPAMSYDVQSEIWTLSWRTRTVVLADIEVRVVLTLASSRSGPGILGLILSTMDDQSSEWRRWRCSCERSVNPPRPRHGKTFGMSSVQAWLVRLQPTADSR